MKKISILLLLCLGSVVFSEDVVLEYYLDDGTIQYRTVDSSIEELRINKGKTTKVLGLEKLINLKTLVIDRAYRMSDYSFIEEAKNLEVLVLRFMEIDNYDFISPLHELKALIIQSSQIKNYKLNLSNNRELSYLEITNSKLQKMVEIENFPCHLGKINFAYNLISDVTSYEGHNCDIFLIGNPIPEENFDSNIILETFYDLIPIEYQRFIQ